jgi:hypothetical protein
MTEINNVDRIAALELQLITIKEKYKQIEEEKKIMDLQVRSLVKDPKSRKVSGLVVTTDGGARKTLRDVVETYIMPKVKFQRDADLFSMQRGSIGWELVKQMRVSPANVEEQVMWWGDRMKIVKDLMREHRSTANRKIKMEVMKGKSYSYEKLYVFCMINHPSYPSNRLFYYYISPLDRINEE